MELIEAQIAQIKNLKLIYVYAIDSVFQGDTDKYVGAKVVYGNDNIFELDYKSNFFTTFIKRILDRYNKEKSKRNIVLLGDLTKQLVNDSFFTILKKKEENKQSYGIPMFEVKSNEIKKYEKYLKRLLETILKVEINYDTIKVNSIDGFNNRYRVDYNVGIVNKFFNMLIFIEENGNLNFKIRSVDQKNLEINGTISIKDDILNMVWEDKTNNLSGSITYDSKDIAMEERVEKDSKIILADNTVDTLIDDDEKLISFYLDLCSLENLKNIIKIDDYSYLMSEESNLIEGEEGIFYNLKNCQINIFNDQVNVRYSIKNSLSKYKDQMNFVLDELTHEFTLKKVNINDKYYILLEKKSTYNGLKGYSYQIISLNNDVDLTRPFEIKSKHTIADKVETFDSIKEHVKVFERGKRNGKENSK